MCPTFLATGEEVMSTRGRANVIRKILQWRENGHDPLESEELDAALSNCLSCKGCTPECPSNVNLALLKAELLYAAIRKHGFGLRERILSRPDLLGRNRLRVSANGKCRAKFRAVANINGKNDRAYRPNGRCRNTRARRFDRWFNRRSSPSGVEGSRGGSFKETSTGSLDFDAARDDVILWDDTFVRYNESHIGIAAVKVLEALGLHVSLVSRAQMLRPSRIQPGKPRLGGEIRRAQRQPSLITSKCQSGSDQLSTTPIVFLEPSCYSMFAEDYRELKIPGAESIAQRSFLFEKFVDDLLEREPERARFRQHKESVAIHAHCHAKSIVESRIHGAVGRETSRAKGEVARHGLLRNGWRIRNDGSEA